MTSETGKNINKGYIMNHSKKFGKIEVDILESQLRSKNPWDLVPTCLDMGEESRTISRNYGLIDDVFEGREVNIFKGRDLYNFGCIKLEWRYLVGLWM